MKKLHFWSNRLEWINNEYLYVDNVLSVMFKETCGALDDSSRRLGTSRKLLSAICLWFR